MDDTNLDRMDDVLERFARHRIPPCFEVAEDSPNENLVNALTAHGLAPASYLCFYARGPVGHGERDDLTVERWGPDRVDAFFDLLETASDHPIPAEIRELRGSHYCTDRFRAYVALVDGSPVAWGTLFVHDGVGFLANAFTQPAARGLGCHTELLRVRLTDALRLPTGWLVTDVVPGSASERNIRRAGFQPVATQVHWRPAAAG